MFKKLVLANTNCNSMIKARTISTLFNAEKTNLPIPKPVGRSTPGALNLSQASIKLIAAIKPTQIKVAAVAYGN